MGPSKENLAMTCRSAYQYLLGCFSYYGKGNKNDCLSRFKIFDLASIRSQPVVGGEQFQGDVHRVLLNFKRNQKNDKMIALHGASSPAKSTSVDALQMLLLWKGTASC